MPAYWLLLTMCLSPAHCVERLYPHPIAGYQTCAYMAAAMIRHPATPWRGPWHCVRGHKPNVPVMASPAAGTHA